MLKSKMLLVIIVYKALITWHSKWKYAFKLIRQGTLVLTSAAVEGRSLWHFSCVDPEDHTQFKCLFVLFLSLISFFIYVPGPRAPPPLPPTNGLPVCESLIAALVAVQMALCWCFTIGLRSVCLMPLTHTQTSPLQLSHFCLFLVFIK